MTNNFAQNNLKSGTDINITELLETLGKNLERMKNKPETVQWSEVLLALSHVQPRRILAAGKRLDSKTLYDLKGVIDELWESEKERTIAELEHNRLCAKWIRELKEQGFTPKDFGYSEEATWKVISFV